MNRDEMRPTMPLSIYLNFHHLHHYLCSMARTVVIGASPNPGRYSHRATLQLAAFGEEVFPVGIRTGKIGDLNIITTRPIIEDVETVTLYVGPRNQTSWIDYILSLHPKRIIFNPGTENPEFESILRTKNISFEYACTLVMIATGTYAEL